MTDAPPIPLLELKSLSKQYPGVAALRDVSLSVMRAEVHVLVRGERRRQIDFDFAGHRGSGADRRDDCV